MKKFNKTLAIAAFAAISMFSAQSAKAVVNTDVTKYVQPQTELTEAQKIRIPIFPGFSIGLDDLVNLANKLLHGFPAAPA